MTKPDELEWRLQERVKELNLLHATTRLLQSNRAPLQVVLTELAALLPPAWQHPDVCQARIRYGTTEASTPFWFDSPWKMTTAFSTSDGDDGVVEVAYLQQMPVAVDGPFLAEERHLIDSVAELLAAYLEHNRSARKARRRARDDEDAFRPLRTALLADLPNAIARNQLMLHYQPKIDLQRGRTVAVEALVRWQHPEHGLILPDRFIWLADSAQLIDALTQWVLERALNQWHDWMRANLQLGLSINLSARNLLDRMLRAKILELAKELVVPLDFLTLEITEGTIVSDPARAQRVMTDLHHLGVRFTMEDVGIGPRAPASLKELPLSRVKLDKSLIMNYGKARNAAIVREAIESAHAHGMRVTAEGVEDEATLAALQALGCDLAQGYLFSRPLPEDELRTWLRDSRWGYVDPVVSA